MSAVQGATVLFGGLGLFLLGMGMMTDGLKLSAGAALQRVLAGTARTRWHGLGSGMLVTALVQSSSVVTVATIGFVNAGMLGLAPALWVLFGANVGTTMTGWIVALVGLKFKIEVLALPLVGVGVLLRITGQGQRRASIGTALAGLGLLFLGIAMMQQSFVGLASQFTLPQGDGLTTVVAQLGMGLAMTVLMQSSSASMTIALTAAHGGLLTAEGAAAVVIGANIGTTVTALLATIDATPNARRAALAHVVFNALTGLVALGLLPWLIGVLGIALQWLGLASDPAIQVAMFHTLFNVLGVLLMWPLADRLTRWLQQRFRAREEDESQPRHLDANVLAVPDLALVALEHEVARIGHIAVRMIRSALAGARTATLARDHATIVSLDLAASAFAERMNRNAMSQVASARLAELLRVQRYHETAAEQALAAAPLPVLPGSLGDMAALPALQARFRQNAEALLSLCDTVDGEPEAQALGTASAAMELAYQGLKAGLLAAGADGRVRLVDMEEALRRYSALRRAAQQATKARRRASVDTG